MQKTESISAISMKVQPKILFIHPGLSTFVQKDVDILKDAFELDIHYFDISAKSKLVTSFPKLFAKLLLKGRSYDAVVIQFAGYQSFLPTLLKKLFGFKVFVVLAGTDCNTLPSINYGSYQNKLLAPFTAFSIKNADLLLPVAETLVHTYYTYDGNDFPEQGYKFHVKNVQTPHKTIHFGFEKEQWKIGKKIPNTFATIGANLGTNYALQLKGIDLILDLAPLFPEMKFSIVGGTSMQRVVPENVLLLDKMNPVELGEFIATQQFYFQLSMSEGFPNALCEAMMSGCVPIVSDVSSMPMIVGDVGYILKKKNTAMLEELVKSAMANYSEDLPQHARDIIVTNYPSEKRHALLISTIQEVLATKK